MPVTPIQRLACALKAVTDGGDAHKLVDLARRYGVPGIAARRAAREIAINADAYLKICRAAGIDPVTGGRDVVDEPLPDLCLTRLAIKVFMVVIGGQSLRTLSKKWGVEYTAINRAKHQQPVNVDNFLRICAGLGDHPHLFLKRKPMFHGEQSVQQPERASA